MSHCNIAFIVLVDFANHCNKHNNIVISVIRQTRLFQVLHDMLFSENIISFKNSLDAPCIFCANLTAADPNHLHHVHTFITTCVMQYTRYRECWRLCANDLATSSNVFCEVWDPCNRNSMFISNKILLILWITIHDIWQEVIMLQLTREACGSSCCRPLIGLPMT